LSHRHTSPLSCIIVHLSHRHAAYSCCCGHLSHRHTSPLSGLRAAVTPSHSACSCCSGHFSHRHASPLSCMSAAVTPSRNLFMLLWSLVTPSRKPTEWLEGSCHTFTPGNSEARGGQLPHRHTAAYSRCFGHLSHRHASPLLSGLSAECHTPVTQPASCC
jgi:hypothetical protein